MTLGILGGAGYIGSHVVRYLQAQGVQLAVYDNFSHGHRDALQGVPVCEGDIGDAERLRHFLKRYQVEAVMNFAGWIEVSGSVRQPRVYYDNNLLQHFVMLNTLLDCGVRHFIFSSSCAVYGLPQSLPIDEAHPYGPISAYGRTKLAVEYLLSDYAQAYDFHYVSLRYFNASGAAPDGSLGERHHPETHLIPLVLETALQERPCFTIFGTDYPTADGTCIRDYVHVWDLAQAHWLALQWLREQQRSEVFNLGNGRGYSVREVISAAEQVTGRTVPVREAERRPGDPPVLVGNSAKAQQLLGWQPEYAALSEMIQTAWSWKQWQSLSLKSI